MKLRAWKVVDNKLYAVVNDKFVVINPDWSWTTIATIKTSYGPAWMDYNQFSLCIADGSYGYTYNGQTFAEIEAFTGGRGMTFLDGFLLSAGIGDSGQEYFCYASGVYNASSWNGLAFGSVESSPDKLSIPVALKDAAVMYGEQSVEIWNYNGDGSLFPFSFLPGTALKYGLAAINSIADFMSSKAALLRNGNQLLVGLLEGYTLFSLMKNQPEVAAEWGRYGRVDDAVACSYSIEGFLIYQITFPSEGKTWAYEGNNGVWCRMETNSGKFIGVIAIEWNNKVIFADSDANLYYFDTASDMDLSYPVFIRLESNPIRGYSRRRSVNRVTLDMATGETIFFDGDYPPAIDVAMSPDGGHSFKPMRTCSIGKQGEYQNRVIARRLGAGKDIVIAVSRSGMGEQLSSPVRYTIMSQAEVDISE